MPSLLAKNTSLTIKVIRCLPNPIPSTGQNSKAIKSQPEVNLRSQTNNTKVGAPLDATDNLFICSNLSHSRAYIQYLDWTQVKQEISFFSAPFNKYLRLMLIVKITFSPLQDISCILPSFLVAISLDVFHNPLISVLLNYHHQQFLNTIHAIIEYYTSG